jgi:hypothetical protein
MRRAILTASITLLIVLPGHGAPTGTELIIPAVGGVDDGTARFHTTVSVTNNGTKAVDYTMEYLRTGELNAQPVHIEESIGAGATRTYDDIAATAFGMTDVPGALRIRASGDLFVSARLDHQRLRYDGVPSRVGIARGETARLKGVQQAAGAGTHLMFAESDGRDITLHLRMHSATGSLVYEGDLTLRPYEQQLMSVEMLTQAQVVDGVLEASGVSGEGRAIFAGSTVADRAQDATFTIADKSITGDMLADGAAVRSLNGLTDRVTLSAGANVTVTQVAGGLQISASGTPGPKGPSGPPGPQGAQGIVSVTYAASNDAIDVPEKETLLSIPVTVPADGQKIWVQANAGAHLVSHTTGEIGIYITRGNTTYRSIPARAVTQVLATHRTNIVLHLGTFYLTPALTAGTWTVSLVATRHNGSDSLGAGESALTAMVLNP